MPLVLADGARLWQEVRQPARVDLLLARLATREQLRTLRALGFTRISFGVQDLDPVVQKAVGRIQPAELVEDIVAASREAAAVSTWLSRT